ncbi:hypothetical protein WDW37_17915 [Bdellovibrionota bacterium FG-1]
MPLERERIVSSEKDRELKIVVSDEVYQRLQQIKGLLAHAKPNATLGELLEYLVNETLPRLEKKKGVAPKGKALDQEEVPPIRATAAAIVPTAAAKALPEGQRVHLPAALGGSNDNQNLQALCKAHNLQQAQEKLGEFKNG